MSICTISGLEEYAPSLSSPWNIQRIHHLFARLQFGASKETKLEALQVSSPVDFIKGLIEEAKALEPTPISEFNQMTTNEIKDYIRENVNGRFAFATKNYSRNARIGVLKGYINGNTLRDRVAFILSNLIVTAQSGNYNYPISLQYYSKLEKYALGNYKDLIREIGTDPMMLVYLDGVSNTKNKPNENFAREFYELFTLGADNGYTQQDIVETARAFTGWRRGGADNSTISYFTANRFDNGEKTIFGQTGNWGYDDVIDIVFEHRSEQIAKYVCTRMYQEFISVDVNEDIVAVLSQTFLNHGFEMAPMLSQLLCSQHFFEENTFSTIIKSPIDLFINWWNDFSPSFRNRYNQDNTLDASVISLSQTILSPPSVFGWPGDTEWITTELLPFRWELLKDFINETYRGNAASFSDFVIGIPKSGSSTEFLTINETNPEVVVNSVIDYMFPRGISNAAIREEMVEVFKSEDVPMSYYEDQTWDLSYETVNDQCLDLIMALIQLPDFQLR